MQFCEEVFDQNYNKLAPVVLKQFVSVQVSETGYITNYTVTS